MSVLTFFKYKTSSKPIFKNLDKMNANCDDPLILLRNEEFCDEQLERIVATL